MKMETNDPESDNNNEPDNDHVPDYVQWPKCGLKNQPSLLKYSTPQYKDHYP